MIRFENVTYSYPFSQKCAVKGINLHVRAGELALVSGMSGCGKTTLMRLANGLCPGYFLGTLQGSVVVDGKNISSMPLKDISRMVGTLFQDPEQQFFALSVEDELAFVHEWRGLPAEKTREKVRSSAKAFGLCSVLHHSIHELSEGQKQKVALASILSQEPRVLVLDEPTANLDPESTAELASRLRALKESGMAILVADHRLYWLKAVADHVFIMKNGEICARGNFSLLKDEGLRTGCGLRSCYVEDMRMSLPDALPNTKNAPNKSGREHSFRVEGLSFGYSSKKDIFNNVSFSLAPGVTAIIGENGAGKTTLARLLTGLNKAREGSFFIHGAKVAQKELLGHVGIVLQNADHQLHMKTVKQELEVSRELFRLRAGEALAAQAFSAAELLAMFGLSSLAGRHPQSLSGGEKQRLVIACAFVSMPSVLILDEPTSGLDGRNMRLIGGALQLLAQRGCCVLVITHDLELMNLCCTHALRLPFAEEKKEMFYEQAFFSLV